MKKIFALIILLEIFTAAAGFHQAQAADAGYTLLQPLPGFGPASGGARVASLSDYLQWLFAFAISIAGIAAVMVIAISGVAYMVSYGNPGKMESAKERITQALLGLLLAVSAWLILYTINPDLVKNGLTIPPIIENTGGASGSW
jgi:hypothetical protein